MATQKTYRIELKTLSQATTYEYEFLLEDEFFRHVEATEVKRGKVRAEVSVVRLARAFEMTFHLVGVVAVMCDRCLDDVEMPVETTERLIVTFGKSYEEASEEHVIVPESEGAVDVSWFMYEYIILALPMRRVHDDGLCNQEMEQKLKELSPNIEDN